MPTSVVRTCAPSSHQPAVAAPACARSHFVSSIGAGCSRSCRPPFGVLSWGGGGGRWRRGGMRGGSVLPGRARPLASLTTAIVPVCGSPLLPCPPATGRRWPAASRRAEWRPGGRVGGWVGGRAGRRPWGWAGGQGGTSGCKGGGGSSSVPLPFPPHTSLSVDGGCQRPMQGVGAGRGRAGGRERAGGVRRGATATAVAAVTAAVDFSSPPTPPPPPSRPSFHTQLA